MARIRIELPQADLDDLQDRLPTRKRGWNQYRTAATWVELMRRLGDERYGAHGNDGGSMISPRSAALDPEHAIGVHVTPGSTTRCAARLQ
jgi:hypothetical protein